MRSSWRQIILRSPVALTVASVTGASVGLSVLALFALTYALDLGFTDEFALYIGVAVVIPLVVAAPVSWLIARLLREVEQAREQAQALAWKDELTGLCNRRRFAELATRELLLARRTGLPLAAVLIDVDDFKLVNDHHGHAVGDTLLAQVARAAADSVRGTDLVARWGGEEFALVLPRTTADEAEGLLQRVRQALREPALAPTGQRIPNCTASVGIAMLSDADEDFQALIDRADHAMYRAKAAGKDRIVMAPMPAPEPPIRPADRQPAAEPGMAR